MKTTNNRENNNNINTLLSDITSISKEIVSLSYQSTNSTETKQIAATIHEETKNTQKIIDIQKKLSTESTSDDLKRIKKSIKAQTKSCYAIIPYLDDKDKKQFGNLVNNLKNKYTETLSFLEMHAKEHEILKSLKADWIDVTEPPRRNHSASRHPISIVKEKILDVFKRLGFIPIDAPELETEHYNFDSLNIPKTHPARNENDSFYTAHNLLLRTQTSSAQIHAMERTEPPLAVVHSGRVFRRETTDASHYHTFYQVEGLLIDKHVSMADLKGTLIEFSQMLFGAKTKIRLRPDYFPFTRPSAEFAASCFMCSSENPQPNCSPCQGSGWIEMGGCGLVDPHVLKGANIDPHAWNGFAFGLGVERIAMLLYAVPDIRLFYENDWRFLSQFIMER